VLQVPTHQALSGTGQLAGEIRGEPASLLVVDIDPRRVPDQGVEHCSRLEQGHAQQLVPKSEAHRKCALVPVQTIDREQDHNFARSQRTEAVHESPVIDDDTSLVHVVAAHRPEDRDGQLALANGQVVVIANVEPVEVKRQDPRTSRNAIAAAVLGPKRLPGRVAKAAVQAPPAFTFLDPS
jgi:hypothetical protein